MATSGNPAFPTSIGAKPDDAAADARSGGNQAQAGTAGTSGSETQRTRQQGDALGRVVQGAHATIDSLADRAAPYVQNLQQGVSSAGASLEEGANRAREIGDEWTESLRRTVRENPLGAVATALVLGLLVARITRR
jgi:hypothetical protein